MEDASRARKTQLADSLDHIRRTPLGAISADHVAGVVRRIRARDVAARDVGTQPVDVAAFSSAI